MVDYRDLTSIKEYLATIPRTPYHTYGRFDVIDLVEFSIYVFAGTKDPLSSPVEMLNRITDFESVGIGIWENYPDEAQWAIGVKSDLRFRSFDWSDCFSDNNGRSTNHIAWLVPIDVVCQIIKDVYSVSQMKALW